MLLISAATVFPFELLMARDADLFALVEGEKENEEENNRKSKEKGGGEKEAEEVESEFLLGQMFSQFAYTHDCEVALHHFARWESPMLPVLLPPPEQS